MDRILDRLMRNLPPETDADNRIVIRYGLEIFILKVVFTAAIFIMAIAVGCFIETLLFMIFFIPLREAAGGYHSRSRILCFIESLCLVGAVLVAVKLPALQNLYTELIAAGAGVLAAVLLVIFAPVDNEDKRLAPDETRVLRTKSRIILAVIITVAIALFITSKIFAIEILATAYMCSALSVVASGGLVVTELLHRRGTENEE